MISFGFLDGGVSFPDVCVLDDVLKNLVILFRLDKRVVHEVRVRAGRFFRFREYLSDRRRKRMHDFELGCSGRRID